MDLGKVLFPGGKKEEEGTGRTPTSVFAVEAVFILFLPTYTIFLTATNYVRQA